MKQSFLLLAAAAMLASCQKSVIDDNAPVSEVSPSEKQFTFTLCGDFSDQWTATRASLQADGKELTDVWVLDYMNGFLVQQLHQSDNTAPDFGQPSMTLSYGSHHVYFIASRGSGATLDTDAKAITFSSVRDTFWKDYEVTVASTSNGNRAVTLDRVVTKLRLIFNDAIPATAATFNVIPETWYYGFNYTTGEPVATATSQTITVNIPSTSVGLTGEIVSIFSFSTAAEWTTDVTINSKTSSGDVLGSATIVDVPFKVNRVSELSGPLFSSGGSLTMSLNTAWDTSHVGTW